MDQIVVDDSFARQVPAALGPCLVFDSAGKRLGCFTPEVDPTLYESIQPSVTDDELERRERAGGGRTLPEIISDLKHRT